VPKRVRELLVATITVEMLTQGAYFDSRNIWGLHFNRDSVRRAFRNLIDSEVIKRSGRRGKYLLTDKFLNAMKEDVARVRPRGIFIHYPDFGVFDICGIGSWSEDEIEVYVKRLRKHWLQASRASGSSPHTVD